MSQKQLWAPWRMEYIAETQKKDNKVPCLFCTLRKSSDDRNNLVVHRGERNYVVLNKYPYNNGHLMVVPHAHVARLEDLPHEELTEMAVMTKKAVRAIEGVYKAAGFNIGMNIGEAGGAGIKEHIHQHIVPRWVGDTNFMPVLSDTKSMPQHLMKSYDLLFAYFQEHL